MTVKLKAENYSGEQVYANVKRVLMDRTRWANDGNGHMDKIEGDVMVETESGECLYFDNQRFDFEILP